MSFFEAVWNNPLLLSAIIAGLLASVVSGIIGSYVVVKRIVFISGSISHAVLGGIGFCLWLERAKGITWASPLFGALAAAVLSALIIGWIHLNYPSTRRFCHCSHLVNWNGGRGVIYFANPRIQCRTDEFFDRKYFMGFSNRSVYFDSVRCDYFNRRYLPS